MQSKQCNGGGNGDTTTENPIKQIQSTDDDTLLCREFAKEKERVESRAGFMALKELTGLTKLVFAGRRYV